LRPSIEKSTSANVWVVLILRGTRSSAANISIVFFESTSFLCSYILLSFITCSVTFKLLKIILRGYKCTISVMLVVSIRILISEFLIKYLVSLRRVTMSMCSKPSTITNTLHFSIFRTLKT